MPYVGILGLDAVLTSEGDIVALEYNTFLQEHDCQGVLALMKENLFYLMEACTIGAFADDYNRIEMTDYTAVSCVLSAGKKSGAVISGLDTLDEATKIAHFNTVKNKYLEYETTGDRTLLVTRTAKTISRAAGNLYEELELIEFDGKKHRKDLCTVLF
jgi:phosphoribosylamine--glycine ligase